MIAQKPPTLGNPVIKAAQIKRFSPPFLAQFEVPGALFVVIGVTQFHLLFKLKVNYFWF